MCNIIHSLNLLLFSLVGGGSRNQIPLNENLTFPVSVPNGNFEVLVMISLSSNVTGDYRLDLTSVYPDGTVINNTRTRTSFGPIMDSSSVNFGTPLFAKLQAIRTINRIDILQQKIIFSVQQLQGDVCYPYGQVDQVTYVSAALISSSLPQRIVTPINSVVYVNHEGIFSFNRNSNSMTFNGPLLLCVSSFYGRAFITNVASLAQDIIGHHYNISTTFVAPRIAEDNDTLSANTPFSSALLRLGSDVSGVNSSYIRIMAVLSHPGTPQATDTEWRVNGEVFTSDPSKGRLISPNGFEVILSPLAPNHAGVYTFTVRNAAGSSSASTNVAFRPMNCKYTILVVEFKIIANCNYLLKFLP